MKKNQLAAAFREFVNKSCSWNPFYRNAIKQYKAIYCINKETQIQIEKIVGKSVELLPELALREEYRNIDYFKRNNQTLPNSFCRKAYRKKRNCIFSRCFKLYAK